MYICKDPLRAAAPPAQAPLREAGGTPPSPGTFAGSPPQHWPICKQPPISKIWSVRYFVYISEQSNICKQWLG